jgi:hypothetical protein
MKNFTVHHARKIIMALSLTAMILCSWFSVLDLPASKCVDASLKNALISFGTARALNAAISVLQGTEIAVQPMGVGVTLTLGQFLDPVNDLVEKFSTLMLAACVALGVQKLMIAFGGYWPVSLLLTLSAIVWIWLSFREHSPPRWLSRMLVILLMARFAIPMVTIGTDLLTQKFMANEYKNSQQAIGSVPGKINEFNSNSPLPADPGWWDKLKNGAQALGGKVSDAVNVRAHIKSLQKAAETWTEHIIKIIVIFLLQTLVIPLLLIWALYAVARGTFEQSITTPTILS